MGDHHRCAPAAWRSPQVSSACAKAWFSLTSDACLCVVSCPRGLASHWYLRDPWAGVQRTLPLLCGLRRRQRADVALQVKPRFCRKVSLSAAAQSTTPTHPNHPPTHPFPCALCLLPFLDIAPSGVEAMLPSRATDRSRGEEHIFHVIRSYRLAILILVR